MTMILTQSGYNYALHVSDRLVSTVVGQRVDPFEPLANKSIVLVTEGAAVALAYTGLATLDDVPTDQRLAEILIGRRYPVPPEPFAMDFGKPLPWTGIRAALEALRGELESGWHRVRRGNQKIYFAILGTGWRWRAGKRARRLTFMITKGFGTASFQLWLRNDRGWMNVLGAPSGPVSRVNLRALHEVAQRTRRIDEEKMAVVQAIREVASIRTMGVGPNCMGVLIPRPDADRRWIRIRYLPTEGHRLNVPLPGRPAVPAAFTPWILGRVCRPEALTSASGRRFIPSPGWIATSGRIGRA